MTLWEILKANKTGIAPDMFTMLAASKMNGGRDRLHELSGVPPLSFMSKGKPLTAWSIVGNAVQNGTPTRDSPIIPQGTGDLETSGEKAGQYKILISSAKTTTPVYLSEVETTRRIRKLVFDGTENWNLYPLSSAKNVERFFLVLSKKCISIGSIISSHFPTLANNSDTEHTRCGGNPIKEVYIYISRTIATKPAELKSYLAQQYANGTPVTMWYVLATEETAVVNEPLMKIGAYADTLSMEQAGVQIPTLNGTTVIDVDTAVKPESMTIKYRR